MARQKLLLFQCGSDTVIVLNNIFTMFLIIFLYCLSFIHCNYINSTTPTVIIPQQLLLPDTSGINGQLTANYNVDNFFSLWIVFHNDDIKVSDQPFTIFAPINAATEDTKSFLRNPEHMKQLLLNHIVLGTQININDMKEENLTAITGRTITISLKNNKFYANDALIIKPPIQLMHGVILVVDNYILGKEDLNKTQYPENIPNNLLGKISDTINIINRTKDVKDQIKNNTNIKLVDNLFQVLSVLKEGARVFQHFLSKSNVTKLLKNGQEYTILVPCDSAFQRWHPIDWGFYPFSVPEFTEDILRNHFIVGKIRQSNVKNGEEVKTLGGQILKFSLKPTLNVNGVNIVKGDTPIYGGNVMFINEVLFVSESVVSRLHQQHKDKETPPLLAFPWFGAQFLSHAFLALERDHRFTQITRFLNLADLAQYVSGTGYTFFVPNDTAFEQNELNKMPDNYLSNSNGLKLLLNHFVKKRLYKRELINNTTLTTLGGEKIKISNVDGKIKLNDANVIEGEVFVYNLGTMYYIDKLLFPFSRSSIETRTTSDIPLSSTVVEKIPEEITVDTETSHDILLEDTISDHSTSTYQIPTLLTNKLNSSSPIK